MKNIVWKRAATGDYDTTQYGEIHGGALWMVGDANCFELCFVPDPRIALAGQIAAAVFPSVIDAETAKTTAKFALEIADEILRQAGGKQPNLCNCCGKNEADTCTRCVSDIAQETASVAMNCR